MRVPRIVTATTIRRHRLLRSELLILRRLLARNTVDADADTILVKFIQTLKFGIPQIVNEREHTGLQHLIQFSLYR